MAQFRLLVVRLGAMGDILHALPAITALRRTHPLWRIDWVVEPRWRALLCSDNSCGPMIADRIAAERPAERPLIDGIIEADTRQWRSAGLSLANLAAIRALRAGLRAGEYDAVLDMQGAIRSAVIARFTGCRRIVGDALPREQQARWLYTESVSTHAEHVIDQGYELVSTIAADLLEPCAPALPVDAAAESWCTQLMGNEEAFALIHPGAGWGAKRWPAERYARVAEWLAQRGLRVLVNAGPGEEEMAAIVAATHARVRSVRSSVSELIALTRRASLVIGGDTGPLHLACALGRPVIGIYGPTDPARNGPYRFAGGAECVVLRSPGDRRDHRRLQQPEAGLLKVEPEAVCAEAERLLAVR